MCIRNVFWVLVALLGLLPQGEAFATDRLHPPVDVMIDAGHGGIDGGATHGNLLEKDINLQIARNLYGLLEAKGYHVVLNRFGDYALSDDNQWLNNPSRHRRDLAQRKHLVIALRPQIVVSIHTNWSSNPRKHGPLVLYQANHQGYLLAAVTQNALNRVYRTAGRPVPGKTYYLLNHAICPTVIVETGFLSNSGDREKICSSGGQAQIAKALSEAIDEYFLLAGNIQAAQDDAPSWADRLRKWLEKGYRYLRTGSVDTGQ